MISFALPLRWLPLALLAVLVGCGPRPAAPPPLAPPLSPVAAVPPRAAPLTATQMADLSSELRRLASNAPAAGAAIYVRDLDSDLVAQFGAEQRFLSASVIKLAVMGAAYALWEKHPERKTANARTWMELMVTESDNPSTDHLVDMVGGVAAVTRFCRNRGWSHIIMRNKILAVPIRGANNINAREVGELLTAIERRKLVSEAADEEMWQTLTRSKKRNRIPAGVAEFPQVVVGNKTGTIRKVLHDAAIVHTPQRRYVLCVLLSRHRSEWLGEKYCQKVSHAVYQALHSGISTAATATPIAEQR